MLNYDYMNMRFEHHIVNALSKNGNPHDLSCPVNLEVILFSAEIQKEKLMFFRKKQIIMISGSNIYIVDRNKKYFKKKDSL